MYLLLLVCNVRVRFDIFHEILHWEFFLLLVFVLEQPLQIVPGLRLAGNPKHNFEDILRLSNAIVSYSAINEFSISVWRRCSGIRPWSNHLILSVQGCFGSWTNSLKSLRWIFNGGEI